MWMARCDSAMTTTPEMPHGANLWNTVSTTVAPATRAALTSVFLTHSMSSRWPVSHSYRSSTTCEPSTARRADSFAGAESAACCVIPVAPAPISNRLESSPDTSLLEDANQLVIGGRHREAVANYFAQLSPGG